MAVVGGFGAGDEPRYWDGASWIGLPPVDGYPFSSIGTEIELFAGELVNGEQAFDGSA